MAAVSSLLTLATNSVQQKTKKKGHEKKYFLNKIWSTLSKTSGQS